MAEAPKYRIARRLFLAPSGQPGHAGYHQKDQMMQKVFYNDLTPQQKEQTKRFRFLGFPPGEAARRRWYVGEDMTVIAPETPSVRIEFRTEDRFRL